MAVISEDQQRFQTLFELAPDAYYLCDARGRFIDGNEAAEQIVGCARDELIGKSFLALNLLSATDLPRAAKLLALNVVGQPTGPDEFTINRKDGSQVPVEIRTRPIEMDGQRLILGIARDITERKQTELQLQESHNELERRVAERTEQLQEANGRLQAEIEERKAVEESLRAKQGQLLLSLNSTATSCWEVNLKTGTLAGERPTCTWLGYEPEEVPASREWWQSLIHPDDRDIPREALERHLDGRADSYECEYRVRGESGEWYWTLDRGKVVSFDENGSPLLIAGTDTDITERKRSENALLNSERRFRSIFEQAGVAVGVIESRSGRFLRINEKYEQLIGYTNEEITQTTWMAITHPDDVQPDVDSMHGLIEGELTQFTMEKRLIHRNGSIIWINLTVTPLWDSEEEFEQHMVIVEDISERKRAAEEMEIRARQQAAVAEFGLRALAGTSIDELYQDAIQMLARVLNVEFTKVMELTLDGKSLCFKAVEGWDKEAIRDRLIPVTGRSQAGAALQSRDPVVVEDLAADGRFEVTPPLESHGVTSGITVVIHGRERPLGVLGAHCRDKRIFTDNDINFLQAVANVLSEAIERKQTELALTHSEQRLRLVTDNIPAYIAYIDADERFRLINDSNARFKGLSAEKIIGERLCDVIPSEQYRFLNPYIAAVFAGKTVEFESSFDYPGYGIRHLHSSFIPDVGDEGEVRGYYSFATDITQRRQAEEQLRQHSEELAHVARLATAGEMATGLAHELNQPLTAISIYSHACLDSLPPDSPESKNLAPLLEKLRQQSMRAGDIVHRIRQYIKKERFCQTAARVDELVDDVLSLLAAKLTEAAVSVHVDIPNDLGDIFVDHVQIEQVLLNLMLNSVDALCEHDCDERRIDVYVSDANEEFVEISVRDTGPGMADDVVSQVFDAFFSTKTDGMGMGLAICRTMVEAHGGRLAVLSPVEGGVIFSFTVPRSGVRIN